MKTYNLTILFPSSNKWETKQQTTETITASDVEIVGGTFCFRTNGKLVAYYPTQYTIITSITE